MDLEAIQADKILPKSHISKTNTKSVTLIDSSQNSVRNRLIKRTFPFQINNDRAETMSNKEAEELLKKTESQFDLIFIR